MVNSYNNSARTAADNTKTGAQTDLVKQELDNAKATFDQIRANTAKTLADTENVNMDTKLKDATIPRTFEETKSHAEDARRKANENVVHDFDARFYGSVPGQIVRGGGRVMKELNPIGGAGVLLRR